jgi:hypothetical protein
MGGSGRGKGMAILDPIGYVMNEKVLPDNLKYDIDPLYWLNKSAINNTIRVAQGKDQLFQHANPAGRSIPGEFINTMINGMDSRTYEANQRQWNDYYNQTGAYDPNQQVDPVIQSYQEWKAMRGIEGPSGPSQQKPDATRRPPGKKPIAPSLLSDDED